MDNLKMMQTIYKNDHFKKLIDMIKNVDDTHEFEVSINRSEGITISQYIDIAKYLINMAKENDKYELSEETTLDISYAYSSNNLSNYRITIVGEDRINKIMSNLFIRKNHSIFSILTNNIMNKMDEQNLYIINKVKDRENIIDLNEYDIRIRLAEENKVPEKIFKELLVLTEVERNKIIFRFKERLSVLIHANENYDIRIDLTNIKQNMAFNRLDNINSIYELELEIIKNKTKTKSKNDNQIIEDTYNRLFFEIYNIHQLLQKSNKVLTLNSKQNVITTMNQLLYDINKSSPFQLKILLLFCFFSFLDKLILLLLLVDDDDDVNDDLLLDCPFCCDISKLGFNNIPCGHFILLPNIFVILIVLPKNTLTVPIFLLL